MFSCDIAILEVVQSCVVSWNSGIMLVEQVRLFFELMCFCGGTTLLHARKFTWVRFPLGSNLYLLGAAEESI